MARLFHIIGAGDWAAATAAGALSPASLQTEGFVHFSFAAQVGATANRFYRDREDLIVVEFDPDLIDAEVLIEDSEQTGTGFPHIYQAIPTSAAVATHPLARSAAGDLVFAQSDLFSEGFLGDPAVSAEWDTRYAEQDRLWSGQPNGALVAEVAELPPGRVLDVGCGEGADAVWLAGRGWDVTALEVSGVALRRAAGHAREAGVAVSWVHAELARAFQQSEAGTPPTLQAGSFDLVSAQYPAILRTPDAAAERALLAAVAPGGVLLFVHHAGMDTHHDARESGFDPADYIWPAMVAALLDDDWAVDLDVQRPRVSPPSGAGAGAHHVEDLVLRARRLR